MGSAAPRPSGSLGRGALVLTETNPPSGVGRRGGAAPEAVPVSPGGTAGRSGAPSSSGAFCCGVFYCFSDYFVIVLTLLSWLLALSQPGSRERGLALHQPSCCRSPSAMLATQRSASAQPSSTSLCSRLAPNTPGETNKRTNKQERIS